MPIQFCCNRAPSDIPQFMHQISLSRFVPLTFPPIFMKKTPIYVSCPKTTSPACRIAGRSLATKGLSSIGNTYSSQLHRWMVVSQSPPLGPLFFSRSSQFITGRRIQDKNIIVGGDCAIAKSN